jgi:hypothetical protein
VRTSLLALLLLALSSPARAQQPAETLPVFVFDARGAFARLGKSETTAGSFAVAADQLASRSIGLAGGLHVYPIRTHGFAIGIGGELFWTGAVSQPADANGAPIGTPIRRRLQSLSGQLSFNFGRREGWSYLSGGLGPVSFDTYADGKTPDGERPVTLNYGAGARWFNLDHLAFSVDLRFYATKPANPTLIVGERKRQTVMVVSAGISIK